MNKVRTKMLKGMLDVVVLGIVHEKPTHGWRIIKVIRKRYSIYFGASTIYPLLNTLEKKGYLKSKWIEPTSNVEFHTWQKKKAIREGRLVSRPRKVYAITEQGKAMLRRGETELRLITVKSGLDLTVKPLIEVKA